MSDEARSCCSCVCGPLVEHAIGRTHIEIEWTVKGALMMLGGWGENSGSAAVRSAIEYVEAALEARGMAIDATLAYLAAEVASIPVLDNALPPAPSAMRALTDIRDRLAELNDALARVSP